MSSLPNVCGASPNSSLSSRPCPADWKAHARDESEVVRGWRRGVRMAQNRRSRRGEGRKGGACPPHGVRTHRLPLRAAPSANPSDLRGRVFDSTLIAGGARRPLGRGDEHPPSATPLGPQSTNLAAAARVRRSPAFSPPPFPPRPPLAFLSDTRPPRVPTPPARLLLFSGGAQSQAQRRKPKARSAVRLAANGRGRPSGQRRIFRTYAEKGGEAVAAAALLPRHISLTKQSPPNLPQSLSVPQPPSLRCSHVVAARGAGTVASGAGQLSP
eukprot:360479-Chlamydomonas_euryale.AAC.9